MGILSGLPLSQRNTPMVGCVRAWCSGLQVHNTDYWYSVGASHTVLSEVSPLPPPGSDSSRFRSHGEAKGRMRSREGRRGGVLLGLQLCLPASNGSPVHSGHTAVLPLQPRQSVLVDARGAGCSGWSVASAHPTLQAAMCGLQLDWMERKRISQKCVSVEQGSFGELQLFDL